MKKNSCGAYSSYCFCGLQQEHTAQISFQFVDLNKARSHCFALPHAERIERPSSQVYRKSCEHVLLLACAGIHLCEHVLEFICASLCEHVLSIGEARPGTDCFFAFIAPGYAGASDLDKSIRVCTPPKAFKREE